MASLVTITRRTLPVQCPACREHLGSGSPVTPCKACATAHHAACLAEIGCASLNCATPGGYTGNWQANAEGRPALRLPLRHDGELVDVVSFCDPSWLADGHVPVLLSFAADCLATSIYFLGESYESYEEMAVWAEEYAPDLLVHPEYPDDVDHGSRCGECRDGDVPFPYYDPCEHVKAAEVGLIYCNGGQWLPSEFWNAQDLTDSAIIDTIRQWAFDALLAEDYDDTERPS